MEEKKERLIKKIEALVLQLAQKNKGWQALGLAIQEQDPVFFEWWESHLPLLREEVNDLLIDPTDADYQRAFLGKLISLGDSMIKTLKPESLAKDIQTEDKLTQKN